MFDVSEELTEGKDICELLATIKTGTEGYWEKIHNPITEFMPSLTGRSSAEIMLDEIDALGVAEQPIRPLPWFRMMQIQSAWLARRFLDNKSVRSALGRSTTIRVYEKLDGGITAERIEATLEYFQSKLCLQIGEINIQNVAPNVVMLCARNSLKS